MPVTLALKELRLPKLLDKVGFIDSGYVLLLRGAGGHKNGSSFILQFAKHLFSTYCVLGTILHAWDIRAWLLPSTS